ncbi:MAG: maleylpyruvate isomerase N-terminal domain-containing protein [Nocardiopsaceae bacterium]|nr:maleylpyruvate isomerase N-terminal domain-containing protein [Nocardiopsaceae bacterium]
MSNADAIIAELHTGHDRLAGLVSGLSDEELAAPTGASEWDVSEVISHLGSGAEINRAALDAALEGKPNPGMEFARSVWSRWDEAGRRERVDGFLREDTRLLAQYDSLAGRDDLRIDMGFLPEPVDLATAAVFRLTEFALHSWDVRVGFDPAATLAPTEAAQLSQVTAQMAGMLGQPEALGGARAVIRVTTTAPEEVFALRLGESIAIDTDDVPERADGTLSLPAEAWIRLVTGRLGPRHTPAAVTAAGAADLDLLRRVFPGF